MQRNKTTPRSYTYHIKKKKHPPKKTPNKKDIKKRTDKKYTYALQKNIQASQKPNNTYPKKQQIEVLGTYYNAND
ncbi:hypothetical protein, partial [Moraxella porci]|uniref:hypothetical protein n=1 Tax=Moraxella porci TaxID=1288392 RepID=UPI00244AB823